MNNTRLNYSQDIHEDYDSELQNSQSEAEHSDASQVKAKGKGDSMNWYSGLKTFNCVLYLVTLLLALGYYVQTKFESKFMMYIFQGLFIMRPILIAFYSLVMILLEMRRRSAKPMKKGKKNRDDSEFSDSQASESMEHY